jgi:thiosulfate dehydrogenase [quinone] large subunit
MFYAGITKIIDPNWSAAGYLMNAKTFPAFFAWFASPGVLPITNFLNEWGLTILGVSLILGLFVRFTSIFGALLMLLYYFPALQFPLIPPHSYLVDEHIIYALVLLYFAATRAGRVYGLSNWCSNLSICRRFPKIRNWLG